jgi:membrane-associated phospholipid phosphatase
MKTFFPILLLFAFSLNLLAQDEIAVKNNVAQLPGDTVLFLFDSPVQPHSFKMITDSRVWQISKYPVSLFILSGVAYPFEHYIYEVRNHQIPNFRFPYDDYLQWAPGVAMIGMKVGGVDGYSDWGRLLTSVSISGATTVILIGGLKHVIDKERPDASNKNSFPSGHTATAFMNAAWLHKEYGLTRSPLYSIAGYSAATLVGIGRQLNNKHWFSDVLFGAGVGILSVDLGYWASDLIFKDKGIITPHAKRKFVDLKESQPSFIGLNMGYVVSNGINLSDETELAYASGYGVAVEGAWFVNPYLGLGGKLSANTIELTFNRERYYDYHPENKGRIKSIYEDFSGIYSFNAGPYFSYPLFDRLMLGAKLLGGIAHTSSSDLRFEMYPTAEYPEGREVDYLIAGNDTNWSLETGLSATVLLNRNFGVRFFADYLFSGAEITFKKIQDINAVMPVYEKSKPNQSGTHNLIMGLSINAYFF